MPRISPQAALDVLTKQRLVEVAADLGLSLSPNQLKPELLEALTRAFPFRQVLEVLRRDELKIICQTAGIADYGREKATLRERILREGASDTLTKMELTEEVALATGLTKQAGELVVNTVLEEIVESLRAGDKVELRGFGSFKIRQRGARIGRNPSTGEKVKVPAKRIPYFKPGKELKTLD